MILRTTHEFTATFGPLPLTVSAIYTRSTGFEIDTVYCGNIQLDTELHLLEIQCGDAWVTLEQAILDHIAAHAGEWLCDAEDTEAEERGELRRAS